MTTILRGKPVADHIRKQLKNMRETLRDRGIVPGLGVIRVGNNPDDLSYERALMKNCQNLDIDFHVKELPETTKTQRVLEAIEEWNEEDGIHGILVFRPLPAHIDDHRVRWAVDPSKDVDCMHPVNLAKIFESDLSGILPATPAAIMEFIKYYDIDVFGKTVAVVNRSLVFGRPMAMMLLTLDASPIICHSKTKKLPEILQRADVVILATGAAKAFGEEYFHQDSIILDVGMSLDKEGKLSGDSDFENLQGKVKYITPPTGGVGSTTTALLMKQLLERCE